MTRRRHARKPKPVPFRYRDVAPAELNLTVWNSVKLALFQARFTAAMATPQ